MGFFITSVGPGDGANLGGLEGADRQCQMLATAENAGNRSDLPPRVEPVLMRELGSSSCRSGALG